MGKAVEGRDQSPSVHLPSSEVLKPSRVEKVLSLKRKINFNSFLGWRDVHFIVKIAVMISVLNWAWYTNRRIVMEPLPAPVPTPPPYVHKMRKWTFDLLMECVSEFFQPSVVGSVILPASGGGPTLLSDLSAHALPSLTHFA